MKKYAFLKKLEESLNGVTYLDYEDALNILKKKSVYDGLTKTFNDVDTLYQNDLDELTNNEVLKLIIKLFAKEHDIKIPEYKEDINNQSDEQRVFRNNLIKGETLDKFEVESLFIKASNQELERIIESYLVEIYDYVFTREGDNNDFFDIVNHCFTVLCDCVYSYDKEKHHSFNNYLYYMIDLTILNIRDEHKRLFGEEDIEQLIISDPSDAINDRVALRQYVKKLLDNSYLTDLERLIIEFRYGIINGEYYDKKFVAKSLGMSEVTESTIEAMAMEKLRKYNNKNMHNLF